MSTPRVYVACLRSYNNGTLHGRWIHATDEDTLNDQVAEMLEGSPEEGAEEWAIHDYEGFEGIRLGEYEDLDHVATLGAMIEEHGKPFVAWYQNAGDAYASDQWEEIFQDEYIGTARTLTDYAYDYVDDLGLFDSCNDLVKRYFDYESFARDLEIGGDIWTAQGGDGVLIYRTQ